MLPVPMSKENSATSPVRAEAPPTLPNMIAFKSHPKEVSKKFSPSPIPIQNSPSSSAENSSVQHVRCTGIRCVPGGIINTLVRTVRPRPIRIRRYRCHAECKYKYKKQQLDCFSADVLHMFHLLHAPCFILACSAIFSTSVSTTSNSLSFR